MIVTHSAEDGLSYIYLTGEIAKSGVGKTIQASPAINLDLDHDGRLVGIELLSEALLHPALKTRATQAAPMDTATPESDQTNGLIAKLLAEAADRRRIATLNRSIVLSPDKGLPQDATLLEKAAAALQAKTATPRCQQEPRPAPLDLPPLDAGKKNTTEAAIIPLVIGREGAPPHKKSTIYLDAASGRAFATEEAALANQWYNSDAYRQEVRQRTAAHRLVSATAVTACDTPVFDPYEGGHNDGFFSSTDELRDFYDTLPGPSYAFCAHNISFDFDLERDLNSYLDNEHHEDAEAHLVDPDEIFQAFDAWKAKQTLSSWHPNFTQIVILDPAGFERDLAEAREILARPSGKPQALSKAA